MTKLIPAALLTFAASTAFADETRQLDAHEHGVGQLDIAFEGNKIALALRAPGADIVGFEYEAKSAEDRAKVDAAVASLARPLDLFALPAGAECSVTEASASLETEEDHEGHDHEDHAAHKDEDHDHDHDHAEHKDDDHDHDHAEHKDDHAGHDHEDHADAEGHTEFHADYVLTCANLPAANQITFAYFDTFPNARELEVQVVTDRGATAFEVERDAPTLDLRDMF